jgi:hypothetical protein
MGERRELPTSWSASRCYQTPWGRRAGHRGPSHWRRSSVPPSAPFLLPLCRDLARITHSRGVDGDGTGISRGIRLLAAHLSVSALPTWSWECTAVVTCLPRVELESLELEVLLRHGDGLASSRGWGVSRGYHRSKVESVAVETSSWERELFCLSV